MSRWHSRVVIHMPTAALLRIHHLFPGVAANFDIPDLMQLCFHLLTVSLNHVHFCFKGQVFPFQQENLIIDLQFFGSAGFSRSFGRFIVFFPLLPIRFIFFFIRYRLALLQVFASRCV